MFDALRLDADREVQVPGVETAETKCTSKVSNTYFFKHRFLGPQAADVVGATGRLTGSRHRHHRHPFGHGVSRRNSNVKGVDTRQGERRKHVQKVAS